jgi:hypothetical protein
MHFALGDGHEPLGATGRMLWFEYDMYPTSSCVECFVSLAGDTILGVYRNFQRWSLVGGRRAVGNVFEGNT